MKVEIALAVVQKLFDTRRGALNVFDALHPNQTPTLFYARDERDQEAYVAQYEKQVALISDVEYSVLTVEDVKEITQNDE